MQQMRVWQTIRASALARHLHEEAYAALVLAGGYEEAGDHGRFLARPGDVIFHEQFEAHLDRFPQRGAVLLNLPLSVACFTPGIASVVDADSVARVAERSYKDAVDLLCSMVVAEKPRSPDWPDELAAALIKNPSLRLSRWAEEKAIARWAVSRGFSSVFGISPEAFRARIRSRQALKLIRNTQAPLVSIAAELGFADQSHMTRSVKQLTGMGPRAWRCAANGFKTPTNSGV